MMSREHKDQNRHTYGWRFTAVPVARDVDITDQQRKAMARCVSVLYHIGKQYLGPDRNELKPEEEGEPANPKDKIIAKAIKRYTKAERKKTQKQTAADITDQQTDLVQRIAQAGKAFMVAARTIKQKGGRVKLDMEQLIRCLRLGQKEFPDDPIIHTIFKKLSESGGEKSGVREAGEVYFQIKQTCKLPTPARKAFQVFRLANDPEIDVADLVAVIETDPAITARVLKIANSAFYKSLKPIGAIQDAIVRLGLNMIKKISLGLALISEYKKGACVNFDYELFWADSLARAVAARNIADVRQSPFNADEAFTVGLLCQIGRLGLATAFPQEYARVLKHNHESHSREALELERKTFGLDHNELAAEMMSDWHLPEVFGKAVRYQDTMNDKQLLAPGSPEYELCTLLQWPAKMSQLFTRYEVEREFLEDMVQEAGRIGLTGHKLAQRFDSITHEWADMGKIMEVKIRNVLSWEEIRAQLNDNRRVILAGL